MLLWDAVGERCGQSPYTVREFLLVWCFEHCKQLASLIRIATRLHHLCCKYKWVLFPDVVKCRAVPELELERILQLPAVAIGQCAIHQCGQAVVELLLHRDRMIFPVQ